MKNKLTAVVVIALLSLAWVWLYDNLPDQRGFVVFGAIIAGSLVRR